MWRRLGSGDDDDDDDDDDSIRGLEAVTVTVNMYNNCTLRKCLETISNFHLDFCCCHALSVCFIHTPLDFIR